VFFRTLQGEFDGAIAMYHDQGHVAAKMLGIWQGVNVTLGLPIIRTSVEHGTDFANAGKGTGDPRSLVQALKLAATMAGNRGSKPPGQNWPQEGAESAKGRNKP
jgi:4-hydroxythreonine-4-phosphate dehydrogenase